MKSRKVTNRDIAAAAGVSPTAVSFAMNGKDGISDETRRLIFDTARNMGYTPSLPNKSLNIALLFRNDLYEFEQIFYTEMDSIIMDACRRLPYNLIMASVYHEGEKVLFSDILYTARIDGMLVLGDPGADVLNAIHGLHIPFVILDSSRHDDNCCAVYVDYEMAAFQAACYLIDLGHRDIGYIGKNNISLQDFTLLTFRGFQKATEKRNIALATNRIQLDITDEESLRRAVDRALEGSSMPTALFCCADYYAIFAIRHLHARGLRVPEDISVIGMDDVMISRYLMPALTTVNVDKEKIVRLGLDLLISQISGKKVSSVYINEFEIKNRESVAPPKNHS